MDQLMKSRNSLHDYVGGQLREVRSFAPAEEGHALHQLTPMS